MEFNKIKSVTGIAILGITALLSSAVNAQTTFNIQKRNTNHSIDGNRGAIVGTQAYLWRTNNNNVNQQWIEINRGNGFFSYQKIDTNLCLDGGNGGSRAQPVILFNCNSTNRNQHWRKVSTSGGSFRLEKRNAPGFSIDGNRGASNRQSIYLWNSNNNNVNQQWNFRALTTDTELPDDVDNVEPQPGRYANSSLLDIVPASVDVNVLLDGWWQDYKNNRTYSFPQEGEIVTRTRFVNDGLGSESTNSEFQGVALTLAVYADDQVMFDQLWRYTKNYLDEGSAPGLMPYLINSDGSIADPNSASDGDRDIAFALIAAHEKWGSSNTDYQGEAQAMLDAIWNLEVITPSFPSEWDSNPKNERYEQAVVIRDDAQQAYYPDLYYMTVGNWAKNPYNMFVGVGYASPATLRVFDTFTTNPNHDWERVANDFYTILDRTFSSMTSGSGTTAINGRTYTGAHPASNGLLLPAWTLPTGQSLDSQQFSIVQFAGQTIYDSYLNFARDSARLPVHLMMDYAWFPSANQGGKAENWIDRINMFFNDFSSFAAINDGYDLDGQPWPFGGIYENAFYGSLATATMRNTIDSGEGNMNAWRQSAWNDGFATFTLDGDLYSDDWRLYSAFLLGFEMQNPLQF